jgi:hypothetical protein
MPRESPSGDRESAVDAPTAAPRHRRARRLRAEPKLYISFLPEGRGGRREEKGSIPLEVDVEAHIEERSDCEPGDYRIEKKRSGEFSGEVLFYQKAAPNVSPETGDDLDFEEAVEAGQAISSSGEIARVVNAVLDSRERRQSAQPDPMEQFRQMRELLKEEREEMQRQLQEQSSKQQPHDTFTDFERFLDLQKKLAPEAPRDELSPEDRAQLVLVQKSGLIPEFMKSMREMLRAPEAAAEPEGILPTLIDFAKEALPYVGPTLGPMLGQKLNELMAQVDVNALALKINNTHSAASPSPQSAAAADPRVVAYGQVMRTLVTDLVNNAPPDAMVAATMQLVNANPEIAPLFGQIINATPDDVAAFICAQTGEDVRKLPHYAHWIAGYQTKLRAADSAGAPMGSRGEEQSSNDDSDGPLTFDDVLHFVKQQIIEDQDPAAAVSSVIQLLAEQPDLTSSVHQLLASPSSELVKFLSESTHTDLTIVANAESFVEKLKKGVKARLRVTVAFSSNGQEPSVATETTKT